MSSENSLKNITTLTFESRMATTTSKLLKKKGARVISAPSMQEVPLEDHSAVFVFAKKLLAGDVNILICNTGVGTDMMIKTLKTKYEEPRILEALSKVIIVSRGPKPAGVLRNFNLPVAVKAPEPNSWKEILEAMRQHPSTATLSQKTIAIQEYGTPNDALNKALQTLGAKLLPVPIYRWTLPDNLTPLKNGIQAILNGEVQWVLFTSKTQAKHVIQAAEQETSKTTFLSALNKCKIASIGPVTSKGLKKHGIEPNFEPSRPKLAIFINEIAKQGQQRG